MKRIKRLKSSFKPLLVIAVILGSLGTSFAQKLEINPNVKWTYVRSQELKLNDGGFYQYEFPAQKGYDYIFNLFYNNPDVVVSSIKIYDMQYKPIAASSDTTQKSAAGKKSNASLSFRVQESGTYIVLVGYASKEQAVPSLDSEFILIRRPKVTE